MVHYEYYIYSHHHVNHHGTTTTPTVAHTRYPTDLLHTTLLSTRSHGTMRGLSPLRGHRLIHEPCGRRVAYRRHSNRATVPPYHRTTNPIQHQLDQPPPLSSHCLDQQATPYFATDRKYRNRASRTKRPHSNHTHTHPQPHTPIYTLPTPTPSTYPLIHPPTPHHLSTLSPHLFNPPLPPDCLLHTARRPRQ